MTQPHPQVFCAMCPWHGDAALIGAHLQHVHGVETALAEWPDGSPVVVDETLEPIDFEEPT